MTEPTPEPPPVDYRPIVSRAYLDILHRTADSQGLEGYNRRMQGGMTEAQMRESLIRSDEYAAANPDDGPGEGQDNEGGNMAYPQKIDQFRRTKVTNVTQDNKSVPNKNDVISGTGTASVGYKMHLDTTPALKGTEYGGGNETIRALVKEDGTSPCIEWKWTVNGKEASNSAEMEDPFHLGSYEDDGGCTPSLKLTQAVGSGRHEVKAWPFIRPEYNGGVAVDGEATAAVFYVD